MLCNLAALNIDRAIDCTIIIKIGSGTKFVGTGGGVAVSPNKAITALHGKYKVKQKVTVIDRRGKEMDATVSFMRYVPDSVDIAVVTLSGSAQFRTFMPYSSTPVSLGQELNIIGLTPDAHDNYIPYILPSTVNSIEPTTTLFHSIYYNQYGVSGSGVVCDIRGTEFCVVGVNVASHNQTRPLTPFFEERPKKKAKICEASLAEQVKKSHRKLSGDQLTINSDIHGHHAYNLICEIARVKGLIKFLSK
jgi:hypothetical protein